MKKNPIVLVEDTTKLTNEEWLAMRQGHIPGRNESFLTVGGSEVAAIRGISPWVTPQEIYNTKRGIKPKVEKSGKQFRTGHHAEAYIAEVQLVDWFMDTYGINVRVCTSEAMFNAEENAIFADRRYYQCGEIDELTGDLMHPHAVANTDYVIKINGKIGIVECKSITGNVLSSDYAKKTIVSLSQGKPQPYYEGQCRHYMAVLNVDYCLLTTSWGHGSDNMAVIKIDRDEDIEEEILGIEDDFIEAVRTGSGWDVKSDPKTLLAYYERVYGPADASKFKTLAPEKYDLLMPLLKRKELRKELQDKIKEMDKQDAEVLALLSDEIEDNSKIYCRRGDKEIKLTIKPPSGGRAMKVANGAVSASANFDEETFKKDNPDLYKDYLVSVFDVAGFKAANKAMFEKYKLPGKLSSDGKKYDVELVDLSEKNAEEEKAG